MIHHFNIIIKLLRAQLNESRVKNELLEQALRVIAQENLELELKKIREGKTSSGGEYVTAGQGVRAALSTSRNASPSPQSNKNSTEDDLDNDSDLDEFFDIGKTAF
jgi:hypothetical protein